MIGLPIDHRSTLRLLSNTSCDNEVDRHGGAHRPSPADCRAENQTRHEFASKKAATRTNVQASPKSGFALNRLRLNCRIGAGRGT